ncbi:hypothetical protein P872_16665 [Rhodonellum psychrophilum GCM71 = DSM 17998]|uniref:Uncharacterized protein n=1 Tax=Rhodonellum psychrophilum GCM71 = DSM 17998 TaxID=1123057 RepID=U5C322_9BACT|nr:hypothetical protein P872_16665 [Rhodonellum psychrophilum GCM71 = DSM 17998]
MKFDKKEHSDEAGLIFPFAIRNGLLREAFHWGFNNIWV